MAVKLRFETLPESKISPVYGPFDFAQVDGAELLVGPDGGLFAEFRDGSWSVVEESRTKARNTESWADVVIFGVTNEE